VIRRSLARHSLLAAVAGGAALAAAILTRGAGAEEPHRRIDMSRVFDAGLQQPEAVLTNTPPDPDPLVEKDQWVFDLRWQHGDVWLLGVAKTTFAEPRPTPRAIGRFALELFEGAVLIERVRFDFPMLGAFVVGDGGAPSEPLSFERHLRTRVGVLFPATQRGTRLELVDRATNRRWALSWPAAMPAEASGAVDGGPPPAAP
jgi:hypothetical protein